jgi:hypothetical protein
MWFELIADQPWHPRLATLAVIVGLASNRLVELVVALKGTARQRRPSKPVNARFGRTRRRTGHQAASDAAGAKGRRAEGASDRFTC